MMRFLRHFTSVVLAALAVTVPAHVAHAARQSYTFTKIADNIGPLLGMANASVNNRGTVAFQATLRAGGSAVMMGNGETLVTVADSSIFPDFNAPSINDQDAVVFSVRAAN